MCVWILSWNHCPTPKRGSDTAKRRCDLPAGGANISAVNGTTPFQEAMRLLESGRCIWCESAPASEGSHLCRSCRVDDPEGVLAAVPALVASPTR